MWMWPRVKLKPYIPVVAVDMYPSVMATLSRAEMWSMTYFDNVAVLWPREAEEGRRYWEQPWHVPLEERWEKIGRHDTNGDM